MAPNAMHYHAYFSLVFCTCSDLYFSSIRDKKLNQNFNFRLFPSKLQTITSSVHCDMLTSGSLCLGNREVVKYLYRILMSSCSSPLLPAKRKSLFSTRNMHKGKKQQYEQVWQWGSFCNVLLIIFPSMFIILSKIFPTLKSKMTECIALLSYYWISDHVTGVKCWLKLNTQDYTSRPCLPILQSSRQNVCKYLKDLWRLVTFSKLSNKHR